MEYINTLLDNTWVQLFIIPFMFFLVSKTWDIARDKKNQRLNQEQANEDFRNTIKHMIGEHNTDINNEVTISINRLNLLHRQTAIKYDLKINRLEDVQIAIGRIIKEIHDTPYLPYFIRDQYCTMLEEVYNSINEKDKNDSPDNNNSTKVKESNGKAAIFKSILSEFLPKYSDISWRLTAIVFSSMALFSTLEFSERVLDWVMLPIPEFMIGVFVLVLALTTYLSNGRPRK